jgi:hypothetical protein
LTDERKPYEAPEVTDVEGVPCEGCGLLIVELDGKPIHVHPPCVVWVNKYPAEPDPSWVA